mgnify:CR=1 FL=1
MSQMEIVGRTDSNYSAYHALKVTAAGSVAVSTCTRSTLVYIATLAGGGTNSPAFDLTGAKRIRIYGNASNATFIMIQYASSSNFNDGGSYDYQFMDQINPLTIEGNIIINKVIEIPPNFIRFENTQAESKTLSIRIVVEY